MGSKADRGEVQDLPFPGPNHSETERDFDPPPVNAESGKVRRYALFR